MSEIDFLQKLWKNVLVAIVIFSITSTVGVIVAVRIASAVQGAQIERNTKEIESMKNTFVPRTEANTTNGYMLEKTNKTILDLRDLKQEVSSNQVEIRAELRDIKSILMKN